MPGTVREQMHTRVLEAIVESGENSKGVVLSICPSLVRLERVNQCFCWFGNMLQHGIISGDCIAGLGFRTSNREGMVVRDLLPDRLDERADEVVQDRAQMVGSFISQDLSDWRSLNYHKAVEVIHSIGIYLTAHGVWIARLEGLNDVSQMAQVLTCPAELEFQPVWWREEVYCRHEQEASDQEDTQGRLRDSDSHKRGVRGEPEPETANS